MEDVLIEEGLSPEQFPGQPLANKRFSATVVVSIIFHGLVCLGLIMISSPTGLEIEAPEQISPARMDINLARRVDLSSIQPEQGRQDEGLVIPMPFDSPVGILESEIAIEVETAIVSELLVTETEPDIDADIETGRLPDTEAPSAEQQNTVQTGIEQSINEFMTVQKGELNRQFVEACIRYRNRYGKRSDCPENALAIIRVNEEEIEIVEELFADITRKSDDARRSARLERENDVLKGLLDGNNPASEQIKTRLALNNQYINYLNGNIDPLIAFMSATAFGNDYGRTTRASPVQFGCKESPCIYKFTGFAAKRPSSYVQQSPTLTIQTPLFLPSPD